MGLVNREFSRWIRTGFQEKPEVIMVGPALEAKSGISAVIQKWLEAGLENRVELAYIPTLDEDEPRQYLRKTGNALRAFWRVATAKRRGRCVLHLHMSSGASFYRKLALGAIGKLRGDRLIVHLHASTFQEFYLHGSRLRKRMIRGSFENAHTVIVLSEAWKRFVEDICRPQRLEILYNGVPLVDAATANGSGTDQQAGSSENDFVQILTLGRLGQRKGTYDLVKAFENVVKQAPNAQLILAGDGDLEGVRFLVEKKALDKSVIIAGWISGGKKYETLRKADIYVLPSYNEGLPGSVLEAMSFGKPIVSTPVGGIPELVINRVNGYLVEAGDKVALAEKITELCLSRELRERMGESSRRLVTEKFGINEIVDQLVGIYESIYSVPPQISE